MTRLLALTLAVALIVPSIAAPAFAYEPMPGGGVSTLDMGHEHGGEMPPADPMPPMDPDPSMDPSMPMDPMEPMDMDGDDDMDMADMMMMDPDMSMDMDGDGDLDMVMDMDMDGDMDMDDEALMDDDMSMEPSVSAEPSMSMDPTMPMDPNAHMDMDGDDDMDMADMMMMDPDMSMDMDGDGDLDMVMDMDMDGDMDMDDEAMMEPTMPMGMAMDMDMDGDMDMDDAMMMDMDMSDDESMPAGGGMPADDGMDMDDGMPTDGSMDMDDGMPMDGDMDHMDDDMGMGGSTMTVDVMRVGGSNRFATAAAASQSTFPNGAANVVLANGYSFADALAASTLAGAVKGPVLTTRPESTPESIRLELERLDAKRVYLVGGTGVISSGQFKKLKADGYNVQRVSGQNRYATAAAVARKVAQVKGSAASKQAFVVNGTVPWDALSASPYSYGKGMPILFVNGKGVPADTAKALSDLGIKKAVVVGGTGVVPAAVMAKVAAKTSTADVRVSGKSRFSTAQEIAQYAIDSGWADAKKPSIAAATRAYADALVAGSSAGAKSSVLLLTMPDMLADAGKAFLTKHDDMDHVESVTVFGGTGAVDDDVMMDIESALK